jgi:nicotinate-nucleotide--dimethylbenzimidazole phosphoribosyltransferase
VLDVIASIRPADAAVAAAARAELDRKTKPRGSLGRLEDLACTLAAACGTAAPGRLEPAVVVGAADHGVARQGVSAYPPEVTRQMLANFEAGGAAICVLARLAGARLVVVDAGVGAGTADASAGPAMTREQALEKLAAGIECASALAAEGVGVVALGEMGIGNTTAAAMLVAAVLGVEPERVCGRGTGIDYSQLEAKIAVVRRALEVNAPDPSDPVGVLAAVGGFELAFLAGCMLGAAAARVPVVLDGYPTGAAALVAARLAPALGDYLVAAHLSPEPGHALVLEALGLEPLLELGLRLGEASGAALALPLVAAALAILDEMATFDSAGVTDTGR